MAAVEVPAVDAVPAAAVKVPAAVEVPAAAAIEVPAEVLVAVLVPVSAPNAVLVAAPVPDTVRPPLAELSANVQRVEGAVDKRAAAVRFTELMYLGVKAFMDA